MRTKLFIVVLLISNLLFCNAKSLFNNSSENYKMLNFVKIEDFKSQKLSQCTVNIPDVNFKSALLANNSININGDSEIQCIEAYAYTGVINIKSQMISDLTGIEAFINAVSLDASNNMITSVDLSNNLSFFTVALENNQLTSIDVSALSGLTTLGLSNNPLGSLDVSNNINLQVLVAANCGLTFIDTSANVNLLRINIQYNLLTSIDLSNNIGLLNVALNNNQLRTLDFSNLPNLNFVAVHSNNLSSFDMANGSNQNTNFFLYAKFNNNLKCIKVDQNFTPDPNVWYTDIQTNFSTYCVTSSLPSDLEHAKIEIYPNPASSLLKIKTHDIIDKIEVYSIYGKKMASYNSRKVIDISSFKKDIYFVKITTKKGSAVKRFIKE